MVSGRRAGRANRHLARGLRTRAATPSGCEGTDSQGHMETRRAGHLGPRDAIETDIHEERSWPHRKQSNDEGRPFRQPAPRDRIAGRTGPRASQGKCGRAFTRAGMSFAGTGLLKR
jgi:hypothetical protein